MSRLRRFSLPPLPHTGLFGVFLGVHAVGDALHVLHTGVGCKGKTQRQLVDHDLGREAHAQVGWTELGEEDLIRDVAVRLREAVPELQRRRRAAALFVTASTAVELTSTDMALETERLESELGVPVVWLPGVATAADLYAGYGAVVRALVERVDWRISSADGPVVSLVGNLFHRYEHEQAANLAELRRLVEGLGARLGPTFLAGESYDTLQRAHAARLLVRLPYAGMDVDDLSTVTSREVCGLGLPLGLRATGAWLRGVAAALGVVSSRVEALVSAREARVAPRMDLARRRLGGRRLAIVADTPLAAGWVLLAQELGLDVPLVVLLDRTLGGEASLRAQVAAVGGEVSSGTRVVETPSLLELRGLAGADHDPPPFDLVVRPDLSLADTAWAPLPTLETGFPASHKHFVFPLPELGYNGTLALTQRLLDAVGGVY
jgi:nitrogenase molybdenum-iron protein alpha/beta subunit